MCGHVCVRACRLDLINAIRDFGGYATVAEQLQWSVAKEARRPRGYWGSADNIRAEVDLFNDEFHLQRGTVPQKSFLRKMGRFDIIKALERAGGAGAVQTPTTHPPFPTPPATPRKHKYAPSHTGHFLKAFCWCCARSPLSRFVVGYHVRRHLVQHAHRLAYIRPHSWVVDGCEVVS